MSTKAWWYGNAVNLGPDYWVTSIFPEDNSSLLVGQVYGRTEEEAAERAKQACRAPLDADVVGKVKEALEVSIAFIAAWSGTYKVQYDLDAIHPKHQETLEQVQAALALLRESE